MTSARGQIVTVGVTGASGAILAQKVLELLVAAVRVTRVYLVVTETGQRLFAQELGISSGDLQQLVSRVLGRPSAKIEILPNKMWMPRSPPAAMKWTPCCWCRAP